MDLAENLQMILGMPWLIIAVPQINWIEGTFIFPQKNKLYQQYLDLLRTGIGLILKKK